MGGLENTSIEVLKIMCWCFLALAGVGFTIAWRLAGKVKESADALPKINALILEIREIIFDVREMFAEKQAFDDSDFHHDSDADDEIEERPPQKRRKSKSSKSKAKSKVKDMLAEASDMLSEEE